jgi:hypothetical protein
MQQPDYFFRLAEEFPKYRREILFTAADNNKKDIDRLMAVEGHDDIKNEFNKAVIQLRRIKANGKGQVYGWIGGMVEAVAVTAILIIVL